MNTQIKPEQFFKDVNLEILNRLTTEFPDFESNELSHFLLANRENAVIVNYCFYKVYEVIGHTDREIFLRSKNKLSELLNQLSVHALIELWNEHQPLLVKWYQEKLAQTKSYFELIEYDNIYNIVQLYQKKISFPATSEYLIYYNKIRLTHILLFLDETRLEQVFSNPTISKHIKETILLIPSYESDFLFRHLPIIKKYI
ncbi:MAG: hypothetical protein H7A23_03550 [Leptospiraceae bacterium]|nr:hypothetical protein [Leptospiraceae bacterium]MCP5493605.1 hypothetical protein [Leptospiraceae bacterium]